MHHAFFEVVDVDDESILIRDVGPWDKRKTITNDVEYVVQEIVDMCQGHKKLEYIDSDGIRSEILIKDGKFAGFIP